MSRSRTLNAIIYNYGLFMWWTSIIVNIYTRWKTTLLWLTIIDAHLPIGGRNPFIMH